MNEQPLNLRTALREIRRRRALVLIVAVLCAAAGVAYGVIKPANSTSVALVLLPQSGKSSALGSNISTDEVIAKSTPVLAAAGAKLSPQLGALEVRNLVSVSQPSGQILQIAAQGRTSSDSARLANDVAASFIQYVTRLAAANSGPAVASLKHQSTLYTQQINNLQSQINTVQNRLDSEGAESNAGQADATTLSQLHSEQNQVALQLNSVNNKLTTAQAASGAAAGSSLVLQKATVEPLSKYRLPIEAGIIGFFIGLLGGVVFVLVRAQRETRLRTRDEIARVAGAPVVASLEAPGCATAAAWRELLEGAHRATDEWALRVLLESVRNGGAQYSAVRVISFAKDSAALTTGPRLALHAAANGIRTSFAPGDEAAFAPLRAALSGADAVGQGLPLAFGPEADGGAASQLLVAVAVLDQVPSTLTPSEAVNVLSVSPNFLTADELAQLALAATQDGSTIEGVVVVNPDPSDTTTGRWRDEVVRPFSRIPHRTASESTPSLEPLKGKGNGSPGKLIITGRKG